MTHRLAIGEAVVYRGTEHAELEGMTGNILEVLSPRLLLVGFDLPDGRQPELKIPPEDVGITEAEAAAFLAPKRFDPHHVPHAHA